MWLHLNAKNSSKIKDFDSCVPTCMPEITDYMGFWNGFLKKEKNYTFRQLTSQQWLQISQFCFNITYDPIQASGYHQLCNFYWGFYWQRDYVLQISGLLVKLFYASCDSRQERNWAIIISNTYWSHIYQDLSTKVDFCQVFVIWIVELDDISCSWIFHHQPSCGDICVWWSWLKRIDF